MTISLNNASRILGLAISFSLLSSAAFAQDCAQQLDKVEQVLAESELESGQLDGLRQDLDKARTHADNGNEDECLADAADLQVALLQLDGVDHTLLCDRTTGEEEIGEADMSGTEDVKSALQVSCETK